MKLDVKYFLKKITIQNSFAFYLIINVWVLSRLKWLFDLFNSQDMLFKKITYFLLHASVHLQYFTILWKKGEKINRCYLLHFIALKREMVHSLKHKKVQRKCLILFTFQIIYNTMTLNSNFFFSSDQIFYS